MTDIQALILGIVQGLTEFLPVSSSGHIAIAQALFQLKDPGVTFAIALHIATLLAVLAAFWADVARVAVGVAGGLLSIISGRARATSLWRKNRGFRVGVLLLIASIPAGIVGVFFSATIDRLFGSLLIVGLMLLLTGILLWIADSIRAKGMPLKEYRSAPAFVVGLFQAAAVLPGLSRSGTTITAGRLTGLDREGAARFSFLLSIPTILGAALVDFRDLLGAAATGLGRPLFIGMGAAAVVGYAAIVLVMRLVKAGRLRVFAYYCWAVGSAVMLWQLLGR
ncbi:MAG: undecaprenyl-diphosphate phosphatase [Chloroflexota bacterium]